MTFDLTTMRCSSFPDPAEQARAILDICGKDIHDAQSLVAARLKFARSQEDRHYWDQVGALLSKQAPTADALSSLTEEPSR
jgi:hypothetical protein